MTEITGQRIAPVIAEPVDSQRLAIPAVFYSGAGSWLSFSMLEGDKPVFFRTKEPGGLSEPCQPHLMQFTGLKDRKGIEIYDGDALRAHDDDGESWFVGIVKWLAEDDWLGWCLMNSWGPEMLCVRDQQNLEVIGNIHQNPELLNKVA